jgi:DNA polymerase elongation subunit (family B)
MMQYNISPETLIDPSKYTSEMRQIISDGVTVDKLLFKSLNLSNMSGVTLTPNGQFFRTDIQGFVPKMLEEMYNDRKKFKKMMLVAKQDYENEKDPVKRIELENRIARYDNLQLAKKVSLNSAYGAMGSQYFRFYDLRIALAVTSAGQLSIRWIENKLNGYMNKLLGSSDTDYVIASDTDSIYLRLSELVNKVYGVDGVVKMPTQKVIEFMDRVCEDKLQPFIDRSYEELADYVNAFDQKMQMKREVIANKGIWTAKKRYILNVYDSEGVRFAEPKLKMMGIEAVKSSTPMSCRDKIKESLKIVMNGNEQDFQLFVEAFKQEFKTLPFEDIAFPRGVSDLSKYMSSSELYSKGTPMHVRGAIMFNAFLKKYKLTKKYQLIQDGDKTKFCYMKVPNPVQENVFSILTVLPKEFGVEKYIDYDTQFDKAYLEPLKTIVNTIGWKTERVSSLENFFT